MATVSPSWSIFVLSENKRWKKTRRGTSAHLCFIASLPCAELHLTSVCWLERGLFRPMQIPMQAQHYCSLTKEPSFREWAYAVRLCERSGQFAGRLSDCRPDGTACPIMQGSVAKEKLREGGTGGRKRKVDG
ncbi:hypothetical protein FRC16_004533 [Serendipita sp. 398]|nr:hypothetical protein FRC16_004533 [Serendipita sp. 398]